MRRLCTCPALSAVWAKLLPCVQGAVRTLCAAYAPLAVTSQVQEEIRFAKSPECAAACAFCPVMRPNEAITITGTEVFSAVTGYMFALRYKGCVRCLARAAAASEPATTISS